MLCLTELEYSVIFGPKGNAFVAHSSVQDLNEEEGKGLSPGLCYLEQVCQMLEEIAKRQMHNQALQRETDALGKHKEAGLNQVNSVMEHILWSQTGPGL